MSRNRSLFELFIAFALVLSVFVSIPLQRGGIGLSWDSVNHHIYLGWVADSARFDKDYFAAGSQSYQFPYLYWPIYKMAFWGWSGRTAGVVWAVLHALICFPLLHMARSLMPGGDFFTVLFRLSGVLLGVGTLLVLRAPETTGNDVLAALPFLWALAIGIKATALGGSLSERQLRWYATGIGLLGGVSVAFKLSNGFFLPVILLLTLASGGRVADRLLGVLCWSLAVAGGFWVTYGWWGYQLWVHFGNPVFPFYDGVFSIIRSIIGWRPLVGI